MSECKHRPAIQIAATELKRNGVLRTYDAVYRWTCPDCGRPQRTTRLADTVYALRHAYGWTIQTHAEAGNLAVYTLVRPGDMPGDESTGPHPRQLVGDAKFVRRAAQETLARTGYTPYDGERVPVDAIPDGTAVECGECGWRPRPDQIEARTVMLGGWIEGICRGCTTPKSKVPVKRIFKPVRKAVA